MTCKMIDGTAIATRIRKQIAEKVARFYHLTHIQPRLAVILIGNDPASQIYVKKKREACEEVGIASYLVDPLPDIEHWQNPQAQLEEMICFLNDNKEVHGILVQLPLPKTINVHRIFDVIDPCKDVDVFNPINVGLLVQGRPRFLPCTPHAIQQMLVHSDIVIEEKRVVVINRSDVVGKPLSSMLIQDEDFGNATVTVCHDRTPPELLKDCTKSADIVVVAVGKPNFLTSDMLSPGCAVVDVGINRLKNNKVVGDAHPNCRDVAGYLSKVPGGVGPLTVAMLLENTLKAATLASPL